MADFEDSFSNYSDRFSGNQGGYALIYVHKMSAKDINTCTDYRNSFLSDYHADNICIFNVIFVVPHLRNRPNSCRKPKSDPNLWSGDGMANIDMDHEQINSM